MVYTPENSVFKIATNAPNVKKTVLIASDSFFAYFMFAF